MTLRARLQRLERSTVDVGCPACRGRRGPIVFRTGDRLPDGRVLAVQDDPGPCAACSQVPEQIIEVSETIVDERTGPAG
jgi:hypothetical protein